MPEQKTPDTTPPAVKPAAQPTAKPAAQPTAQPTKIKTAATPSEKEIIPEKYLTQEYDKDNSGKLILEEDEETGGQTKTLVLTKPLLPSGTQAKEGFEKQIEKITTLHGRKVKHKVFQADGETLIKEISCDSRVI